MPGWAYPSWFTVWRPDCPWAGGLPVPALGAVRAVWAYLDGALTAGRGGQKASKPSAFLDGTTSRVLVLLRLVELLPLHSGLRVLPVEECALR